MNRIKGFIWNFLILKMRNRLPSQAVVMKKDTRKESITKNLSSPLWLNMESSASISAS